MPHKITFNATQIRPRAVSLSLRWTMFINLLMDNLLSDDKSSEEKLSIFTDIIDLGLSLIM